MRALGDSPDLGSMGLGEKQNLTASIATTGSTPRVALAQDRPQVGLPPDRRRMTWTMAGIGDVNDRDDDPDQHDEEYLSGTDRGSG
jgi:hypothetical protein